MDTNFTDEQLQSEREKKEQEAEQVLEDEAKTEQTLGKAKGLLGKLKKIPVIGSLVYDITTTIELIGAYMKGDYREVPYRVIVSAMAGIIYLISPIDLIPDPIPVVGWLDDAAVLTFIFNLGVGSELKNYRKWKEKTERQRKKEEYLVNTIRDLEEEKK